MKGLAISVIVLVIFVASGLAHGQMPKEGTMDMVSCGDGKVTTIIADEALTIIGIEARGINLDNLPTKVWDNMSYQSVGMFKIESGKWTGLIYGKWMDQSGDFIVVDISQVGMERDWKFLYGTGKFKGITGGGKGFPSANAKPIVPGTGQNCTKIIGTYAIK